MSSSTHQRSMIILFKVLVTLGLVPLIWGLPQYSNGQDYSFEQKAAKTLETATAMTSTQVGGGTPPPPRVTPVVIETPAASTPGVVQGFTPGLVSWEAAPTAAAAASQQSQHQKRQEHSASPVAYSGDAQNQFEQKAPTTKVSVTALAETSDSTTAQQTTEVANLPPGSAQAPSPSPAAFTPGAVPSSVPGSVPTPGVSDPTPPAPTAPAWRKQRRSDAVDYRTAPVPPPSDGTKRPSSRMEARQADQLAEAPSAQNALYAAQIAHSIAMRQQQQNAPYKMSGPIERRAPQYSPATGTGQPSASKDKKDPASTPAELAPSTPKNNASPTGMTPYASPPAPYIKPTPTADPTWSSPYPVSYDQDTPPTETPDMASIWPRDTNSTGTWLPNLFGGDDGNSTDTTPPPPSSSPNTTTTTNQPPLLPQSGGENSSSNADGSPAGTGGFLTDSPTSSSTNLDGSPAGTGGFLTDSSAGSNADGSPAGTDGFLSDGSKLAARSPQDGTGSSYAEQQPNVAEERI